MCKSVPRFKPNKKAGTVAYLFIFNTGYHLRGLLGNSIKNSPGNKLQIFF